MAEKLVYKLEALNEKNEYELVSEHPTMEAASAASRSCEAGVANTRISHRPAEGDAPKKRGK